MEVITNFDRHRVKGGLGCPEIGVPGPTSREFRFKISMAILEATSHGLAVFPVVQMPKVRAQSILG